MRVVDHLVTSLRKTADYYLDVQVAPACILWTDSDRQWESAVPVLSNELPELLILGDYNLEKRTGPAIWLRCAIAGEIPEVELSPRRPSILYLPGVGRQDLRVVESCPDELKPLVELQFRGAIWSQLNSKDWTILAFLKSQQGGLGLDVAQDTGTKHAMHLALSQLLEEEVEILKGQKLNSDFFNNLLTGGDPIKELLQWLNQGDEFKKIREEHVWKAFVEVCKSKFAFNPEKEGILNGAAKLARHEGPWQSVWERFCEAPRRYPNIPKQINKCNPPNDSIFWHGEAGFEGWPQWNTEKEQALRSELLGLASKPPHEARKKILELNEGHKARCQLVWAELGQASLAVALKYLAVLAETTSKTLAAGSVKDLVEGYSSFGWKADDAVVRALNAVENEDWEAVSTAVRAVYPAWAEESARYLQRLIGEKGYPGGDVSTKATPTYSDGECILFVDGLRYDIALRLSEMLNEKGLKVEQSKVWAALPSVTATGKPAVSPVIGKINGGDVNTDFEPKVADSDKSLKGGYNFSKLLENAGWALIEGANNGSGQGRAWCEYGNIDSEGHHSGAILSKQLEDIIQKICGKVESLMATGWQVIRIVTDHGWLLLPGGLPKTELSAVLAENKWGRCAAIKPGAITNEQLHPWFWNPNVNFALAEGISCFRNGIEYTHGGISLQECLNLELTVTGLGTTKDRKPLAIADVVWKKLRCNIAVDGVFQGHSVDVRTLPGDSSTSVVLSIKVFNESGTASVVVENEELEGKAAYVVLLEPCGELVAQIETVIGGGDE